MLVHGACQCGAVRFTAEIDPARVVVCHCTDCQVMSGGAFRVSSPAAMATLALEGTTKAHLKTADSGNRRAMVFCPECGTHLYAAPAENPTVAMIRLGCVAERAALAPTLQIWTHSALPWLGELDAVPGVPGQPAPAAAPPR